MWTGKWTNELDALYDKYFEMFDGYYPDDYDEILYDAMTYEEFVGYIKQCLKSKKGMPRIVK